MNAFARAAGERAQGTGAAARNSVGVLRQSGRSLVPTAIILALFVPILIVGGLSVRGLITTSFQSAERIRATRALGLETLKLQLDEETGIRGYVVAHDPTLLEPYRTARPLIARALTSLRAAVEQAGVRSALPSVDEAAATNARWLTAFAEPLVAAGKPGDTQAHARLGKTLVDQFRTAVSATDRELALREDAIDVEAEAAVNRIILLIAGSTVIVIALALVFGTLQRRTAQRLEDERRRSEEERRAASELRAAYLAEKRIADTLQDAFTQRPLPTLPTLRFSAMYVPATEEARVGGDWYDALELSQDRVLFAIGDVTGHGLDAAVGMSRARQALIAAALADPEPASVLRRVNADLLRQQAPLVTAVVGYADALAHEFVYSIAGHPPPVLLAPGAPARLLDCGALPLGAIAGTDYTTYRVQAAPGAMLVLYTDGAVEHSRNVLDGETLLLHAAARALESGAEDPASVIHETIFEGNEAGDDVAILTVGIAHDRADGFTVSGSHANADFSGRIGGVVDSIPDALARHGRRRARGRWVQPEVLVS